MDILQILKDDYHHFPKDQTYSLYEKDVYFKDPLNEFNGLERYKKMIQFIDTFFINPKMDLHEIHRSGDTIYMEWTLNLTSPLPWKPRLAIPGRSELKLNDNEIIVAHIDYWDCSRVDVLKQNFFSSQN